MQDSHRHQARCAHQAETEVAVGHPPNVGLSAFSPEILDWFLGRQQIMARFDQQNPVLGNSWPNRGQIQRGHIQHFQCQTLTLWLWAKIRVPIASQALSSNRGVPQGIAPFFISQIGIIQARVTALGTADKKVHSQAVQLWRSQITAVGTQSSVRMIAAIEQREQISERMGNDQRPELPPTPIGKGKYQSKGKNAQSCIDAEL